MSEASPPQPGPSLPKPDSIQIIPPMHPATLKMHEAMLRAAKNAIGIWETWIKERQR